MSLFSSASSETSPRSRPFSKLAVELNYGKAGRQSSARCNWAFISARGFPSDRWSCARRFHASSSSGRDSRYRSVEWIAPLRSLICCWSSARVSQAGEYSVAMYSNTISTSVTSLPASTCLAAARAIRSMCGCSPRPASVVFVVPKHWRMCRFGRSHWLNLDLARARCHGSRSWLPSRPYSTPLTTAGEEKT
jgi:hypothetical protein